MTIKIIKKNFGFIIILWISLISFYLAKYDNGILNNKFFPIGVIFFSGVILLFLYHIIHFEWT